PAATPARIPTGSHESPSSPSLSLRPRSSSRSSRCDARDTTPGAAQDGLGGPAELIADAEGGRGRRSSLTATGLVRSVVDLGGGMSIEVPESPLAASIVGLLTGGWVAHAVSVAARLKIAEDRKSTRLN